jgi:outer membrane receptor protein involved in Fe transport
MRVGRHRFLTSLGIGVGSVLLSTSALAQDTENLLEVLDENVVNGASRSAESARDAPALSTTITTEELRRFGIRHLDEALNFLTLGMVAQDDLSNPQVGARGVAITGDNNNHVLIVLDGMVMNEQAGGAVYLHDVPLDAIDHIEVILGPGSVLYGSEAMFGVINIVTKRAETDREQARGRINFGFSPPFDAQGNFRTPTVSTLGTDNQYSGSLALSFPVFGKPVNVTALVDYSTFRGPSFAFALEPLPIRSDGTPAFNVGPHGVPGSWGGNTSNQWFHDTLGGFVGIDYGDFSFMTRATVTRLAMPQIDASLQNNVGSAFDDSSNANSYTTILSNLRYQRRFSTKLSAMGRAYFGFSEADSSRLVLTHDLPVAGFPLGVLDPVECPIGPTTPCNKTSESASRWLGVELQGTYDWTGDASYVTMAGVDSRFSTVAYEFAAFDAISGLSYGSNPALTHWTGGGSLEENEFSLGVYAQQNLRPWKWLAFNLGVRGDYDPDPLAGSAYQASAVSPRAAIIGNPNDRVTLKAIYSTGFRAPSFLELHEVQGELLPNPNGLQSETVSSYEGIASLRLGRNAISLGGFYSQWHNLIELETVQAQPPVVSEYQNVSSIRNFGGHVTFETHIANRWALGLNLTAAQALRELSAAQETRNPGIGDTVPVTAAPKIFGNARASFDCRDGARTVVALIGRLMGPQLADRAYIGGDPSNLTPTPTAPTQVELRGTVTGDIALLPGLSYSVGADYAFSKWQPYVVGPQQGSPSYLISTPASAELAPVNRLTVFAGLEFTLDTVRRAATSLSTPVSARNGSSIEPASGGVPR